MWNYIILLILTNNLEFKLFKQEIKPLIFQEEPPKKSIKAVLQNIIEEIFYTKYTVYSKNFSTLYEQSKLYNLKLILNPENMSTSNVNNIIIRDETKLMANKQSLSENKYLEYMKKLFGKDMENIDEDNVLSLIQNNVIINEKIKTHISHYMKHLRHQYLTDNLTYINILNNITNILKIRKNLSPDEAWQITNQWMTEEEVFPENAELLGSVLKTMETVNIKFLKRKLGLGTQLKLIFVLDGDQNAIFKPAIFSRDTDIIQGENYDRHYAEIAAFYLSLLFGFRRMPLVIGRKVTIAELLNTGDISLKMRLTIFKKENNTTCIEIKPYQAKVCYQGDAMEGALTLWLSNKFNYTFQTHKWKKESEIFYHSSKEDCENFNIDDNTTNTNFILYLIDTSIFDFLIDNIDRHEFFLINGSQKFTIFLHDHANGFRSAYVDNEYLLSPLYHCCIIRKFTWTRLMAFTDGKLSEAFDIITNQSSILYPLLHHAHLKALDRRLKIVLSTVLYCIDKKKNSPVIIDL